MDLLNAEDRKVFLQDIKSNENRLRKQKSVKDYDVLNDNLYDYVVDYLRSQFSNQTVLEMPIVSSVNIAKRVCNKEASIYKTAPERSFTNLSDEQQKELIQKYAEWGINQKMFKANLYYKDQQQTCLMVVPKKKNIDVRVLLLHQYDVKPKDDNPEEADAYVMSTFDKSLFSPVNQTDGTNQTTADVDDYKATLEKYLTWTEQNNFVFNGKGDAITEIFPNPIGELPFIDIVADKDFEFYVRCGQALTDFAIQFCGALSDLGNIVKMQGYAVAWLKGPKAAMPTAALKVGPTVVLHLVQDELTGAAADFGFANPNSDIAGAISYLEMLLSHFLTSRGLDPNVVNGKMQSSKYNSGLDRLLAMIDMFEATKQDYDLFMKAEKKLFGLIKKWSQVTAGTEQAFLSFAIPDNCELNCIHTKPEQVQSETEQLTNAAKRIDIGIMSKKQALMKIDGVDEDKADEILAEVDEEMKTDPLNEEVDPAKKKAEAYPA